MGTKTFFLTLLIMGLMLVLFTFSYHYLAVADNDNETTVENLTRQAMTEAVNYGNLRVNEEVTINEEVAIEAVVRMYAASDSFNDGNRYLNVVEVNSKPPILAVESYVELSTPLKKYLNNFIPVLNKPNYTRSREVVIFESVDTTKPPKE